MSRELVRIGTATSFVTLGWLPPLQGEERRAREERERERRRKAYFSGIHGKSGKTVVVSKRVVSRGRRGMRCNGYEGGPIRGPVVGIVEEREQVEGQLEEGEGG